MLKPRDRTLYRCRQDVRSWLNPTNAIFFHKIETQIQKVTPHIILPISILEGAKLRTDLAA